MPISGAVPDWLFSIVAITTLFVVMFDLGLAIVTDEFRWVAERPGLMLRGLVSVLVVVPACAWLVARAFDLPRAAEIGIVLMAISPGAPVALRRSLGAGSHHAFAPALHISIAILAVVSMPAWVAIFDAWYGGTATVAPGDLARQVFVAQLLPLGLGMLGRRFFPALAQRLDARLRRLGGLLLIVLLVLALVDIWQEVLGAGLRVAFAVVAVTLLALASGHLLGGPQPATRTATAISSAARNPGLALLVATINSASPAITRAVLAYVVVSALTATPYVIWRTRVANRTA